MSTGCLEGGKGLRQVHFWTLVRTFDQIYQKLPFENKVLLHVVAIIGCLGCKHILISPPEHPTMSDSQISRNLNGCRICEKVHWKQVNNGAIYVKRNLNDSYRLLLILWLTGCCWMP